MDEKDAKLNLSSRFTALNPNAAEFIPSARRSIAGNTTNGNVKIQEIPGSSGKSILGQLESNASNDSDDEVHEYWRRQLPDDITPDLNFMEEDELQDPGHLSFEDFSIHDETSSFPSDAELGTQQNTFPLGGNNFSLSERLGYSGSIYGENQSSAFMQFINGSQHLTDKRERNHYQVDRESTASLIHDLLTDRALTKDDAINPVDFLASQFPGFSAESLADVYYANGCDINFTIEILTQLELQIDGGFSHNLNPKVSAGPSFSALDFPALPVSDAQNGLEKYNGDLQQGPSINRSLSRVSGGAIDFASAVRKIVPRDSGHRNYENGNVGTSSSHLLAGSNSGHQKLISGHKLRAPPANRAAPAWLETGDAVANMYSETREEARDFARLRNACFEQARQAYLIGNKALAKELSMKGQLYNMKMKEAHEKARETIYLQRNRAAAELEGYGRGGQNRIIDLHGLHVSEALHYLKQELGVLRSIVRSSGRRVQVLICVGTGHHTKGSRTPARLPVAIEQYLLGEGLHYTEPQQGLLRVVIH